MTQGSTEPRPEQESDRPESPLDGDGSGEGVELTVGEPNTFEPEEDPDAATPDADPEP